MQTDIQKPGDSNFRGAAFLGAFAELRNVTISFVMFVHLSVRMEQLGFHWTYFYEV
jgi:hypothetical protein